MLRLGLCCAFLEQPIKFRTTTASSIGKLTRRQALSKLSELCQNNGVCAAVENRGAGRSKNVAPEER